MGDRRQFFIPNMSEEEAETTYRMMKINAGLSLQSPFSFIVTAVGLASGWFVVGVILFSWISFFSGTSFKDATHPQLAFLMSMVYCAGIVIVTYSSWKSGESFSGFFKTFLPVIFGVALTSFLLRPDWWLGSKLRKMMRLLIPKNNNK